MKVAEGEASKVVTPQVVRTAETGLRGDADKAVSEAIPPSRFVNMKIGIESWINRWLLGDAIHRAG